MLNVGVCFTVVLVPCNLVVTCWERADLLAVVCVEFSCVLSRLFIAALWSPAGKGLTSWLLLVMFIVFLLFSHAVSWVRCGT